MEAKGTVMSEKEMENIIWHTATEGIPTQRGYGGALIKAQAEISFNAGQREAYDFGWLTGRKSGIRKAVDYLKMHYYIEAPEEEIKKIEEDK